jgi:mannitol-1-/sugar-/sorbitol-6-phosphatase
VSARNSLAFDSRYSAFLFDMDGTVLNSIAAAERIWRAWAVGHGLDVKTFLPTIHGARSVDTVARLGLPGVDPETEAFAITQAEIDDVEGIVEVTGAANFLRSLPAARWAIVTSAPRALARRRLEAAGIPFPAVLITSEDVASGKPNPEGYMLAARELGVEAADCLVFEDAAVGILAGEAAGADVIVVTSTHVHPIVTAHATIESYESLLASADEDGFMHLLSKSGQI